MIDLRAMQLDVRDSIAHLTFTNAARGNPIDGVFCAELRAVSLELAHHQAVRAVLIKAEGKMFSVGGDINAFTADLDALPRSIAVWANDLHDGIARLQRIDAPLVAAVHGVCVGGMTAFVAGADFVVASTDAKFVAGYANIGYSCDAGASIMLSRRMGYARARRYLMLGEILDPKAAFDCGLVDEVVEPDTLAARAEEMAAQLAAGPTRAYGELKRLFLSAENQPLEAQLANEALSLARTAATEDARGALLAFRHKQKPIFNGR
jgi:2-(1,2-epoxy-1,2-dihydrophenyl)acetyl-CoA isomerase